jgi:hypothetical protein
MKITIELDHEDLQEAVEIINDLQIEVQSMIAKLEDLQSVIESAQE